MDNCFTVAYNYLNLRYEIPHEWNGYTRKDMDLFVKSEKKFLSRKDHIAFFKSFCKKTEVAKKDDIVLTRKSVGVSINQFTYWVYSEDLGRIEHKKINKECLIMRVGNG